MSPDGGTKKEQKRAPTHPLNPCLWMPFVLTSLFYLISAARWKLSTIPTLLFHQTHPLSQADNWRNASSVCLQDHCPYLRPWPFSLIPLIPVKKRTFHGRGSPRANLPSIPAPPPPPPFLILQQMATFAIEEGASFAVLRKEAEQAREKLTRTLAINGKPLQRLLSCQPASSALSSVC